MQMCSIFSNADFLFHAHMHTIHISVLYIIINYLHYRQTCSIRLFRSFCTVQFCILFWNQLLLVWNDLMMKMDGECLRYLCYNCLSLLNNCGRIAWDMFVYKRMGLRRFEILFGFLLFQIWNSFLVGDFGLVFLIMIHFLLYMSFYLLRNALCFVYVLTLWFRKFVRWLYVLFCGNCFFYLFNKYLCYFFNEWYCIYFNFIVKYI